MSTAPLIFDVWAAATPNGTALGELSAAYGKSYRHVHQAMGAGQFTINRHHAQAAWAATDNLVRVRRVAGGPFAYDSANYIGAFWIEAGDDILLDGDKEEGGEEWTRGGRTAEACLRWARLYPDAFDSRNDKFTTTTRIDGNWHIKDKTAGEVLAIFLRDLDDRSPDPLPFVSKDFGVTLDTNDVAWSDTGTDWAIPVGTTGLDLLATCVSGDLFYRVDPDFTFHAYEDEPGDNLTGSITFEAGVNIVTAAERQIQARETVGRTIVQGTKENGKLKYREVVNATVEADLPGRREGFVEFKRTPTNAKLDKAGNRYINRTKRNHDGIPTLTVAEDTGEEAFIDYVPGDRVTLTVSGEYAAVDVRIYSITLEEDDAGNVDPTLEFEASPFDPSQGDEAKISGGGGGSGNGSCADCPPIPPFVPVPGDVSDCTDGTGTYTPQADGSYPPLNSGTSDSEGFLQYGLAGLYPTTVPDPNHAGGWNFPDYGSGGSPDYAGDCASNIARVLAVGPGTITISTASYGAARTLTWAVQHLDTDGITVITDSSGSVSVGASIVGVIPDDGFCVHWVDVGDDASACGSKWGFAGYTWAPTDVYVPAPLEGQSHVEELAGDGSTVEFTTNYPYAENSLEVWVDGLLTPVTQTDPTAGTFTFDTAPALGAIIIARYMNAGTTGTGATNDVPDASTPTIAVAAEDVTYDNGTSGLAASDVQAALDELAASSGADAELNIEGGQSVVNAIGTTGATEGIDPTDGNVVTATLGDDTAFTFAAPSGSGGATLELWISTGAGGFTPTFAATAGTVAWDGDTPTLDTTAGVTYRVIGERVPGTTNDWVLTLVGSGSAVGALDDLSDVTITTPAADDTLRYVGGEWINDNRRWEPVTTNPGGGPELVWDGDDIVMTWRAY